MRIRQGVRGAGARTNKAFRGAAGRQFYTASASVRSSEFDSISFPFSRTSHGLYIIFQAGEYFSNTGLKYHNQSENSGENSKNEGYQLLGVHFIYDTLGVIPVSMNSRP